VIDAASTANLALVHSPTLLLAGAAATLLMVTTSLRTKAMMAMPALLLVGWLVVHHQSSTMRAVPDAIVFLVLAHFVWELVTNQIRISWTRPYVVLVLMFAAAVLIQTWNPIIRAVGGASTGARSYLAPMSMFLIGLAVMRTASDARALLKVLVATTVVVDGYMLKQLVLGFDAAERRYWSNSSAGVLTEHKLFSTLVSPDDYGLIAAVLAIACLAAHSARIWPRLSLLAGLVSMLGAAASGVRINLVALLAAASVYLLAQLSYRDTGRFALGALVVGAAALLVLGMSVAATAPQPRYAIGVNHNPLATEVAKLALLKQGTADADIASRVVRARDFLSYMVHHPWGAGPSVIDALNQSSLTNAGAAALIPGGGAPPPQASPPPRLPTYMIDQPWIFQHDYFFIDAGVELGAIPLLLFVTILLVGFVLAFEAVRSRAAEPEVRALLGLSGAAAVALLIANLTNEAFRTVEVAGPLWFLLAMPVAFALPRPSAPCHPDLVRQPASSA